MATPNGTAARPPIRIHNGRPPGASATLSQPTVQAPTPANDIWHSAIMPVRPDTRPMLCSATPEISTEVAR